MKGIHLPGGCGSQRAVGPGPAPAEPHLLIAPYVQREAVLSSRIERTKAALSDLLRNEMPGPPVSRKTSDVSP